MNKDTKSILIGKVLYSAVSPDIRVKLKKTVRFFHPVIPAPARLHYLWPAVWRLEMWLPVPVSGQQWARLLHSYNIRMALKWGQCFSLISSF